MLELILTCRKTEQQQKMTTIGTIKPFGDKQTQFHELLEQKQAQPQCQIWRTTSVHREGAGRSPTGKHLGV